MSQVTSRTGSPAKNAWATGGTIFAATIMVMIGIFQILMGISAIANDSFLVIRGDYVYNVDTTAFGWIHLGLGALILLTGIALYTGATWAKVAGIILVVVSAVDNFLFLPYYPIWSLLLIGMDVFVIWSLAHSLRYSSNRDEEMAVGGGAVMAGDPGYGSDRWAATNPSAGYRASDPEAARRASDMATPPSGARHAQEAQPEMHSAMAGGMQQPGMQQPGMGQPGMGQPGMGQPGMPQSGGMPPTGQPPRTQQPPTDTP